MLLYIGQGSIAPINKLTKHFDVTLSVVIVEQMFLLTFDGTRWLVWTMWNGFILWQDIQSIVGSH